jgi:hypothetical protein
MSIVVYAEASSGSNPGHMVVGEEPADAGRSYFGYRFDPADLPEEFRASERWRDYLFEHAVPGKIVDETAYVNMLLAIGAREYYEKRAECAIPIESKLPPREEWNPHGWYSFNPDNPRPGKEPCFNCVKWAIIIANSLVENFLPAVRQGRLKLILKHLQKRSA